MLLGQLYFLQLLIYCKKVLAVDSKNPRALAVIFNFFASLIAISIFVANGSYLKFRLPHESSAWWFLLIACLFYTLFERLRFKIAKLLDASILSTITNVSVLVAFTGSLILYGESITAEKILGALLIITALVLVSYKKSSGATAKGIILSVLASIALGIAWALDKKGASFFGSEEYNIFVWTLPVLFIYLPYVKTKDLIYEFKTASWKIAILAGLNVIGYLLQLKAMVMTDVTRVIPVTQTSTILTIFAGVIFLKERDNLLRKIIAGVLVVLGVSFLV